MQFEKTGLPSPMLSYKSNKNVRSLLVRAKLPPLDCDNEATTLNEFELEYTPLSNSQQGV